jgi:hypothetical protein
MGGKELVKVDEVRQLIYNIRGAQVMLDKDLAILYNVKPIRLREQVKRNIKRFPADFMFQLTNEEVERKQLEADDNFKKIFNAIEAKEIVPKQGIFFNGQIFDAYKFVSDLFRTAKKSIVIIDNYIDDTVLTHLARRHQDVGVTILTKSISKHLLLDVKKCTLVA